jgi:hypothetical protein
MNSTQNESETYHDQEFWLNIVSHSRTLDYLYIYTLVPFFTVSLGLGLLSFFILTKKEFKNNSFFKHMRAYVLNSIFLFAILATTFVPITRRVFNFTNSYESLFYGCYFYLPLIAVFYLNSSLIEICIVIERLLYFLPSRYKMIKKFGFKKYCLILQALSLLINLPNFFSSYPSFMDVKLDSNTTFRAYYWGKTDFAQSPTGVVVLYLMYFVRDVLTLLVKIALNLKLIFMVRNYLSRIKAEKLAFALKISTGLELHDKKKLDAANESSYISKKERNQTYIALFMCMFSFFNHVFYTLSYVYFFLLRLEPAGVALYLALVSLGLKHVFNFFMMYKYKYLFRDELKKSFHNLFSYKHDSSSSL